MLCPFKFKPSVNQSAGLHRLFVATDLLQNPKWGLGNLHDHFFFFWRNNIYISNNKKN